MPALRADAARSRARILEAARALPPDGIRHNDLARDTGLGVGTVYRHFPTVTSLLEALHRDALGELVAVARDAASSPSPGKAFTDLVKTGAELQLSRDGLQAVLVAKDVSPEVRALREELLDLSAVALDAAVRDGQVRPDVSIEQVQRLVCGVEHAVRLGDGHDRDLLLGVMIAGLRP
ncbi:TetR/AcrR family transcriptional regulator [Isoptericola halotolerans]|uniref:AcrR family transcriptional regulator n=1 Tax=Isoptericola halotolerans TaxID=300560 RepID=A0ABX2A761_9MICO|nr:TetR/AcrR family transcriptional regulator [Isoptericola halotolerans]NOV98629.1 AcrR family transcriptional regulator [Isoptericola halotolerans]